MLTPHPHLYWWNYICVRLTRNGRDWWYQEQRQISVPGSRFLAMQLVYRMRNQLGNIGRCIFTAVSNRTSWLKQLPFRQVLSNVRTGNFYPQAFRGLTECKPGKRQNRSFCWTTIFSFLVLSHNPIIRCCRP